MMTIAQAWKYSTSPTNFVFKQSIHLLIYGSSVFLKWQLWLWLVIRMAALATKKITFYSLFVFSGFQSVLLRGFRALSEQRPIAEDYSTFK